jgi:uncharacterized protein YbaP (TraB family)
MRSVLLGCFIAVAPLVFGQSSSNYELLWEVKSKHSSKPSYVFGSMHSNDPRLFNFPDSLYVAFTNSDAVVLETDLTEVYDQFDVRLQWLNFELFQEDKNYTASRKATKTAYGSEDGRPQFLDAYFQQTGFCANKQFFPLESVEDQLNLANKIDIFETTSVQNLFITKEMFIETYLKGDIAGLTSLLKNQFKNSPKAYDALITQRNKNMSKGLDSLMRKQSVFCAVGSGHLYGPEGILQLLRAKGYKVRPVKATYGEGAKEEKALMMSWRTFHYSDTLFEFEQEFSGKPKELEALGCIKKHLILQELGQGNTYEIFVHEDAMYLDDQRTTFLETKNNKIIETTPFYDAVAIEGLVNDPLKGYQWKKIIQIGDVAYELICYGGNKFMHSNRPKTFFSRFLYLGH